MDEENIVRRMINGDMDAFGELMEKYERPALRAAWLISGNAADSEDIVQELSLIHIWFSSMPDGSRVIPGRKFQRPSARMQICFSWWPGSPSRLDVYKRQ